MHLVVSVDRRVLFLRLKMIRTMPSHSVKFTGGGGLRSSIRTTRESTFGGGRKLFRFTCVRANGFKTTNVWVRGAFPTRVHNARDAMNGSISALRKRNATLHRCKKLGAKYQTEFFRKRYQYCSPLFKEKSERT